MALVELSDFDIPVATSRDAQERARGLAGRAQRALRWHGERLGWQPNARLTVADRNDWPAVAAVPIYGVPQTWHDHTIVAADNAPLFDELARALMASTPAPVRQRLVDRFGDPPCLLEFFDQFLYHELVHLFCEQVPVREAPMWVTELLCNLGMVGYLSVDEPDALPVMRDVVAASVHVAPDSLTCTALDDMHLAFDAGPLNVGWYILRLTSLADHLWHTAGPQLYPAMYRLLRAPAPDGAAPGPVTQDDVAALSPAVRAALARWPHA
ncbi:MAG: hypothetical protein ACT4RN_13460 [Pseudonocardia sp.]